MRTRRLRVLGLVMILMLLLAACGGGGEEAEEGGATSEPAGAASEADGAETTVGADAEGVQALRDAGTVRIGVKYDQPLFGVNTPSGVEGFDAEIAKLMVEGIFRDGDPESHIEFTEAVSANREPFLQNDEVDMVIATYTMNEERDQVVDFAGPYYETGQQLMVPEGNPEGIQAPEDLNTSDLRSCSVEGSTSLQNFQELAPDADIITFDTYTKCAEAMNDGRVDATTTDGAILFGLVDEFGGFEVVGEEFSDEPYGIGIPDGATDLRLYLNERICQIQENGEWDQAYENTVGVVAETPAPPPIDPAFGDPVFPEGSECPQASGAGATSSEAGSEATSEMTSEPAAGASEAAS
ncbi:MAG TPA: glutamate ABC transporter substrate-binding protein [Euzebyales bacterium]|nr:glutamate ABC transporter substrate-binding protein [Euzebyales bacterium]